MPKSGRFPRARTPEKRKNSREGTINNGLLVKLPVTRRRLSRARKQKQLKLLRDMKRNVSLLWVVLLAAAVAGGASRASADDVLPLIPYPSSVEVGEGTLPMASLNRITYVGDSTKTYAEDLAERLSLVAGLELSLEESDGTAHDSAVNMVYAEREEGLEAYSLSITESAVTITAEGRAGFFYGLQTLKQLMPVSVYGEERDSTSEWALPLVEIEDAPLLRHRGFMLDIARHYFDMDEVKKLLDVASVYKLNRFHWHLTDDQGWRVEIPEWPKLTTVGAIRSSSLTVNDPTNDVTFYDDTEYGRGCYYTLDELSEVVEYAKERCIEIIPEIDLPGHMVAAIASYPILSCDTTLTYEVRVEKGISSDVLNVGSDTVIDFLKCVLGHIAEVFPYEYIHIGGDECPTDEWEDNEECQARIEAEGLSDVDDLQPWLVELLGTWLNEEYGKSVVVWDELLSAWKSSYETEPVIMAWNSASYTATAAARGFKSICVPYSPLYLDQLQVDPDEMDVDAPYMGGWGDYLINTVEDVYEFDPLAYVEGEEDYMLGTQGNLWTESCCSNEEAEYQYFPRLLALSEMAWLDEDKKDYDDFYERLQENVKILDEKDVVYATYCIEEEELTDMEEAIEEATWLLEESEAGKAGYPSEESYAALEEALKTAEALEEPGDEDVETLEAAIEAYKTADITMPEEGKMYQIVSASTYFRLRYDGSTVYAKGDYLYFHYTPQLEPEELWYLTPQEEGGYIISRVSNGMEVSMPSYDEAVKLVEEDGTPVMLTVPTEENGDYTYIPGVMLITALEDSASSKARRFYGETSGQVVAYDEEQLCTPGTWRLTEVEDYTTFLESLYDKCVLIEETAEPGSYNEPTEEALEFLQTNLIDPAAETLASDEAVSEETYLAYVAIYQQYDDMEKTGLLESIDEDVYYRIKNAYFTDYYAYVGSTTLVKPGEYESGNDGFNWQFVKNDDGTVYIYNALKGTAAYVTSTDTETRVRVGKDYAWTLGETTTDLGDTGVTILAEGGENAWYTNPDAWNYVLLEPYTWGASIWTLEKSGKSVTAGINTVTVETDEDEETPTRYYDLQGREVSEPTEGIYVTNKHKKILK